MEELEIASQDCEPLIDDSPRKENNVNNRRKKDKVRFARCYYRRGLLISLSLLALILISLIYLWQEESVIDPRVYIDKISLKPDNLINYSEILQENFQFDIKGHDVMVFLHIQKTGGTTFGKHLVRDLDLERECECHRGMKGGVRKKMRCDCFRPGKGEQNWLFSRYSTGWKCGLHPDWTELTNCVDLYLKGLEDDAHTRRYFYITMLRDPTARFISEYKHVQRGATWKTATMMCGGRSWGELLPRCYKGEDWSGVSIHEFIDCEHNLAVNRQTRMLADLELVHCYNKSAMDAKERDRIMLESAKSNLEKMAYFGITEDQRVSQYLFEETFNLRFRRVFDQYNVTHSKNTLKKLGSKVVKKIKELNHLDNELYSFAKQLLQNRFNKLKSTDTAYEEHLSHLNNDKELQISYQDIENED